MDSETKQAIDSIWKELERLSTETDDLKEKLGRHTHRLSGSPVTKVIGTVIPKDGIGIPFVQG